MSPIYQFFRSKVDPGNVARLMEIRPKAIAAAQAACPELLRVDLVRLDEDTWLDILVWTDRAAAASAGEKLGHIDELAQMHGLVGEVLTTEIGDLAHSLP